MASRWLYGICQSDKIQVAPTADPPVLVFIVICYTVTRFYCISAGNVTSIVSLECVTVIWLAAIFLYFDGPQRSRGGAFDHNTRGVGNLIRRLDFMFRAALRIKTARLPSNAKAATISFCNHW